MTSWPRAHPRSLVVGACSFAGVIALGACAARGSDDLTIDRGFLIQRRYAAPHGRVFSSAARALTELGYVIASRDSSEMGGVLRTAPRFAWDDCVSPEVHAIATHPGIVVVVATRAQGDSTAFRIGVGTVTNVPDALVRGEQISPARLIKTCAVTLVARHVNALLGEAPPVAARALPGDSVASVPDVTEFDRLVAPLRAGDTIVDYTALRMAYTKTLSYRPYPPQWEGLEAMFAALDNREFGEVRRISDSILAVNYVEAEAHLGAMVAADSLADRVRAAFHGAVYRGLIASIGNRSGRTPDSAIVIVNILEEYALLRARGLQQTRVTMVSCNDRLCDRLEVRQPGKKETLVLYFDVSIPQEWGAAHLR